MFSVIAEEWPQCRARLVRLLEGRAGNDKPQTPAESHEPGAALS
jgi:hypothetical protein